MNKEKCREHYAEERRILRKAMIEGKLVLFVGAGASLDSGLPSWSDAIKQISEKLNISSEGLDYMKIPQYYYNSRGRKEYVELMRNIFKYNDNLEIQKIHQNIIKLNTRTVITTNYDCLLEKAAEENAEFIQVISQDKDLPYKTVGKELIKMHGDFEHGNFVLREDDYLYYSENFKLIEAYIKSLIATNVVLFIGYSFNDPDVKHIFSWVKDILKEDFQRAYMLEMYKEFDPHEHDYYKNLGVNVLYASEMYDEFNSNKASEYTNDFIEYILEEDINENEIDEIYEQCKSYSELNYIQKNYIRSMFKKHSAAIDNNKLTPYDVDSDRSNSLFLTLFGSERNKSDNKIELINDTVGKSAVKCIELFERKTGASYNKINIPIGSKDPTKLEIAISEFDYNKIRSIREINEINLDDTTPELYLEQAYISYVLCEYAKAYRYLKKSSQLFYKSNCYVWYFISEFNRQHFGYVAVNDIFSNCSLAERKKIEEEIKTINLETIYNKIPSDKIKNKKFLQDLYTFRTYYTLFQDTYDKSRETEKEANTNYLSYAGIPGYVKLRDQIKDYYYYNAFNYIMVDKYKEGVGIYRLFARTIIESVCSSNLAVDYWERDDVSNSGNIYAHCLEAFDIYIILRYMSKRELGELLELRCNTKIDIDDEARAYLKTIINNVEYSNKLLCNWFWTCLCLIGYIKLDEELVTLILKKINKFVNYYAKNNNIDSYNMEILRFLKNANNQDVISSKVHSEELKQLIDKLLEGILTGDSRYYYKSLIFECLSIYKKINELYFSDRLMSLACSSQFDVLAIIYPLCDKKVKKQIEKTVGKWELDSINDIELYERIVLNGIKEADEETERKILLGIELLKNKDNAISTGNDLYEEVISALANLYLNNKIICKEDAKRVIEESEIDIFKWSIDMDNYDYTNFDVSWLNYCQEALLKTIASFPTAKSEISNKIKLAYLDDDHIEKSILKKYFEYFI